MLVGGGTPDNNTRGKVDSIPALKLLGLKALGLIALKLATDPTIVPPVTSAIQNKQKEMNQMKENAKPPTTSETNNNDEINILVAEVARRLAEQNAQNPNQIRSTLDGLNTVGHEAVGIVSDVSTRSIKILRTLVDVITFKQR